MKSVLHITKNSPNIISHLERGSLEIILNAKQMKILRKKKFWKQKYRVLHELFDLKSSNDYIKYKNIYMYVIYGVSGSNKSFITSHIGKWILVILPSDKQAHLLEIAYISSSISAWWALSIFH